MHVHLCVCTHTHTQTIWVQTGRIVNTAEECFGYRSKEV